MRQAMDALLAKHNEYRKSHCAPDLSWDNSLAASAQSWVDGCRGLKHSSSGNGENIYMRSIDNFDGEDATTAWYNEVYNPGYNYDSPGYNGGTGHFTQVVWKDTTKIGCGYKNCGDGCYVVCQYNPAGNFNTAAKFSVNVLPSTC